jgi:choline kinase/phosphohistidine swiveling domain-containing protein
MSSPVVIVLGAGRPFSGDDPSAVQKISGNRRTLDWILGSFADAAEDPEVHFVGGYRFDDVLSEYPKVHFTRNEEWEDTGTVGSLLAAPLPEDSPVYVCYADTIFEAEIVEELDRSDADAVLAVDTVWRDRYEGREEASLERAEKVALSNGAVAGIGRDLRTREADAEFTGLVRLSPSAVAELRTLVEAGSVTETDDLPELISELDDRLSVETLDIGGRWAELETADDISRFVLDTKANTLRRLGTMVEKSTILEQCSFRVDEWHDDPERICREIADVFGDRSVIVRSSALAEDTWESSNAGRFESVLDVPADDRTALRNAIRRVVDSYPGDEPDDQVLVQPMVPDVDQSGVVMTRSLSGHSPYYVVNYDPVTSSTESVTDGTGDQIRTAFVLKNAASEGVGSAERTHAPSELAVDPLLDAVREVEDVVNHDSLDVEFAIDEDGEVYVLQVRPITVDPGENTVDDDALYRAVENAQRQFERSQPAPPTILGERTVYGVMPDWNPAEIIGRQPKRLAESLYRYLIMDETWARQRAEFGYRDVRPQPLMKCFTGQPYVDVRAVFNSFVPAAVSEEVAEKLVEYYLDRLISNPELHDKVEFDIAITCLPFDFDRRAAPLREAGFSEAELDELRDALRSVTVGAFERVEDGRDLDRVERLEERFRAMQGADLPPLRSVRYLLEDCRRLGTLPFAHLARAAFVATALLRSLERIGTLSPEDVSTFLNSMNTVAREFERDGRRVAAGELAWEEFVDTYGHLRPGTYDITSAAYAQDPENYLRPMVETANEPSDHPDPEDVWDEETKRSIEAALDDIGLPPDADRFIAFLRSAIEGREYAKFVFTKNLSRALEELAAYGDEHGLEREDLAHVTITDILELSTNHPPERNAQWLEERAREGKARHTVTEATELPPLLVDPDGFECFERPAREPNFVTSETVRGNLVEVESEGETPELDGAVVMIPQADPGYDWLFGYDIAGLITMYGGANSHMAVRAAEFGIPAAIGVGEDRYQQLQGADSVELDCTGRTIKRYQ